MLLSNGKIDAPIASSYGLARTSLDMTDEVTGTRRAAHLRGGGPRARHFSCDGNMTAQILTSS